MDASARHDILAFFERLLLPTGQFLEIRIMVPDVQGAQQFFCATVADAIEVIERWNGRANVYVGACPRSRRSGTREAVTIVLAVWADLDFHQIDSTDREHAEQVARERLTQFAFPPTVLVFTGNGIQAWWFFCTPIRISDEYPAEKFEAINRGIAKVLGGDAVHDLARVLRVPGTMNLPDVRKRARGCVPTIARLLEVEGPTYQPDDFADLEARTPTRRLTAPISLGVPIVREPNLDVIEVFLQVLDSLEPDHVLVRTWYGRRSLTDDSRSGWDMALADQLVRAGIRDEYLSDILRAYPLGRGMSATPDYLARTIAKAQDCGRSRP